MGIIEAIILGIIQGLTEFLPISSSGHIELGSVLLNIQAKDNLLFTVVVHFATALSTVVVFYKDIWTIIKDFFSWKKESTSYILKLIISMVPVAIAGLFFEEQIASLFSGNVILVGSMLMVTGTLLALTYYSKKTVGEVTFGRAFIIGLSQAVAIIPGISRSGSTIATALLLGVDKEKATRFSFLMVIVPILGAAFLKVLDYVKDPTIAEDIAFSTLLIGFLSAFIAGLIACSWMIKIVKKGKLIYFAIYCFIIGAVSLIISLV